MRHRMHPNSLANIKKAKRHKSYNQQSYKVPVETINQLYSLMADGVALRPAAKKIDIAFETARKYFEQGDPKRGIKPIKFRLMIFQEKTQKKLDDVLLKRRTHHLETIKKLILQLEAQINAGVLSKKANINQFERLIRMEMWLRGMGGEGVERRIAALTAEDVRLLERDAPAGGRGVIEAAKGGGVETLQE